MVYKLPKGILGGDFVSSHDRNSHSWGSYVQAPALEGFFRRAGALTNFEDQPIQTRYVPPIPVGQRGVPVHRQGASLLKLPQQDVRPPTPTRPALPQQIDRRDQPSVPVKLSMSEVSYLINGQIYKGTLVFLRTQAIKLGDKAAQSRIEAQIAREGGTVSQPTTPTTTPTKTGGSMDLGDLLGKGLDLYAQYQDIRTMQPTVQPVFNPMTGISGDVIDFFSDPVTGTVVPVTKKKPCRRRRKRLATKSDLGDLAALKAILGNGEAFKAWIATHSR